MTRTRIGAVAIAAGLMALGTLNAPSASAASCQNVPGAPVGKPGSITNNSSIAIGVIHLLDGNCAQGAYDTTLQPGEDTFHDLTWKEAAAVYVGPNYGITLSKPGTAAITYPVRSYGREIIEPYLYGGNWTVRVFR